MHTWALWSEKTFSIWLRTRRLCEVRKCSSISPSAPILSPRCQQWLKPPKGLHPGLDQGTTKIGQFEAWWHRHQSEGEAFMAKHDSGAYFVFLSNLTEKESAGPRPRRCSFQVSAHIQMEILKVPDLEVNIPQCATTCLKAWASTDSKYPTCWGTARGRRHQHH